MSQADVIGGRRRLPAKIGLVIGFVAVLAFAVIPTLLMLVTAFDNKYEVRSGVVPVEWGVDNFRFIFEEGKFGTYLRNSIIVAGATVLASALLSLLAAVAVARFKFRFRTALLMMILVVQMVPMEAMVIPLFIQARRLELLNMLLGLIVVYVAFSLAFAIWMLRGFVAAVPRELEEAAYIDGASWPKMFWHVLLPLVAPGLVATSIFSFITAWNEFVFAITFMTSNEKYTAAAGIREFFTQFGTDWGAVMAASTVITVPVMVFFVVVQGRISSGLVAGAVKG